jgi:hypothetical protein
MEGMHTWHNTATMRECWIFVVISRRLCPWVRAIHGKASLISLEWILYKNFHQRWYRQLYEGSASSSRDPPKQIAAFCIWIGSSQTEIPWFEYFLNTVQQKQLLLQDGA